MGPKPAPLSHLFRYYKPSRRFFQPPFSFLFLKRTPYPHYETGTHLPDLFTLVRLARFYGLPTKELVPYLIR